MTTYTYPVGTDREPVSGLTAVEAAQERLAHDGHRHELRHEYDDGRPAWILYASEGSIASYAGAGRMVLAHGSEGLLISHAATEAAAWEELAPQIINAEWRHVPDAMADEAYGRMLSDACD